MSSSKKKIDVIGPMEYGAQYPMFSKKSINERMFEHGLRFKYFDAYIQNGNGYVSWLSYNDEDPTEAWESEVERAFKANGLKSKSKIYVKFGSRYTGYVHEYELVV